LRTRAIAFCLGMLFFAETAVLSQSVITPLFPLKDGTVSPDSCAGDRKELIADQALPAAGWMVFTSAGIHYRDIDAAMLAVYISSVRKPGLCCIHALMKKITAPENGVASTDVLYDDMPIASLELDTSFSAQMILVNITELVLSKAFFGIALRPMRNLSARFSSKEGFPPPAILCYRDTLTPPLQPKWWSADDVPDTSVGKNGDFYLRALQGVIYRKSSGQWDSVANLTIPPKQAPAPAAKKRTRRPPVKKR
jgi:hypothetical protein